jgi:hypothetical protein
MKAYGRGVLALVVSWFVFSLVGSGLGLYTNEASRLGPQIAVAAVTPLLVFGLWFAASKKFREFAMSLNPQLLTLAQAWRLVGFTFVLLEAHRVLPAVFAWPAGYGDMAVGATATFVAWKFSNPGQRRRFIRWQWLGITDLVVAVTMGTTAFLWSPQGPTTGPMTMLPLSLIPTFLVPMFMIFHIICIAQARQWKGENFANAPVRFAESRA